MKMAKTELRRDKKDRSMRTTKHHPDDMEKAFTLVNLTEDNNTRKLCLWVARNDGLEEEDAYKNTQHV